MSCDTYEVLISGTVIARGMALIYALMLVKAIFYDDCDAAVTIRKEDDNGD